MLLTGPSRLHGVLEALHHGVVPTVVAPEPVYDWLTTIGRVSGGGAPREIDGVHFEAMNYPPPPSGIGDRLRGAVRRFRDRQHPPHCEPQVVELRFPDGSRLLHLDLALHHGIDEFWVGRAAARFGNPELILLGLPYGEGAALASWLPRFGPNRVLLAEMVNDDRRELGLPTEMVTPTRDRLVAQGLEVHVFATQTSHRFE